MFLNNSNTKPSLTSSYVTITDHNSPVALAIAPYQPAVDYQSPPAASPKPAPSKLPCRVVLGAGVVVPELAVAVEEEDISRDLEQAVFPSAWPIVLTCVEVGEGSQVDNCLVAAGIVVRRLVEERRRLPIRQWRELRLTQDPLGGELGRLRRRVGELGVGVRWLLRGRLMLVFSFGRGRRGVVREGGY